VDQDDVFETGLYGIYGNPPAELATVPDGAVQFSPLVPGSDDLEAQDPGSP